MSKYIKEVNLNGIRDFLSYEPKTGVFHWKMSPQGRIAVGDMAGNINRHGYRRIFFRRHSFAAHRLAWFFVTGKMPTGQLDHRNGKRDDDRFSNLRLASTFENARNRSSAQGSRSKYLGVSYHRQIRKWAAQIKHNGVNRHLGYFDDEDQAARTYDKAALNLHGEFANPNFGTSA